MNNTDLLMSMQHDLPDDSAVKQAMLFFVQQMRELQELKFNNDQERSEFILIALGHIAATLPVIQITLVEIYKIMLSQQKGKDHVTTTKP